MIKAIIQTFLVLFTLTSALVIYYWRDTQYDPSGMDLVLYFCFLPLLLCLLLFSPYFIYKALKSQQQKKQKQQEQADLAAQVQQQAIENKKEPPQPIEDYSLNIFSAAAWHCFGENEEILQKMMQFSSPELDSELLNSFGLPLLAYRIHAVDQLLEENQTEEETLLTLREQRIQLLIQQQFKQHEQSLSLISEHLKRSALFYEHELAYQYRMHPGWTQENYRENEENSESMPAAVTRLNRLNLYILLAENLAHDWCDLYQEQLLRQIEQEYSLLSAQIHIEFHFLSVENAYATWLEQLQVMAGKSDEVSLIIAADSEIDQDYLNDQFWQNEHYIAAEYTASWCLAADALEIEGMIPLRTLKLGTYVSHLQEYLDQHQVDLLAQLEQSQPFLVLLDETNSKAIKKIGKSFVNINFEPQHTIYTQSYFGHSQNLAAVVAAILSLHLMDNVMTVTYSIQQESTYLYFKNTDIDQHHESSLVA